MAEKASLRDKLPKILYRYRCFDRDGYHLDLIKKAQLWCASPKEFNDPFDVAIPFRFDKADRATKLRWAQEYLKRMKPDLNYQQRRQLARKRLLEIKKQPDYWENVQKWFFGYLYELLGMCCLTAVKDNLLMWSHYSDKHKGFCVGVDTEKLVSLQISLALSLKGLEVERVQYTDKVPDIDFFTSKLSNDQWKKDFATLISTKSKHWAHEREYRLIYWGHPNTTLEIGYDAITEIILGCRTTDADKANLLSIIKQTECNAKVFQARKHARRFSLEFERIV